MKINNKKGFSLVELSIVLIIVALLVSGVVGGRSLINNSKINLINSEYTTLKIAIRSYIDNNNLREYAADKINFKTLIDNGYVDDNSNFVAVTASTVVSKEKEGYPSKINGANWYYSYDATGGNYILTLASSSNNTKGILEEKLCNQFAGRFGSNEKVLKTECKAEESATDSSNKYLLKFTIIDIFQ